MTVLVGVAAGVVFGVAAWLASRELFAGRAFSATNYRGRQVPVGAGVLVAVAAIAAEAVFTVSDAAGHWPGQTGARLLVLLAAVGFALLGLVDDLGAEGDIRGFTGHVRAAARGRLTTGGVKLLGGGLLAVVLAGAADVGNGWRLVPDALLIALCANLGNLFDRAPGRTTKVSILAFVALVAATGAPRDLIGVAVVVGAAIGLLLFDLREELMLGDAGANALGAVLGLGLVLSSGFTARLVVLAVVAALNVASEWVSYSNVIDRIGPLRAADRAGRRR